MEELKNNQGLESLLNEFGVASLQELQKLNHEQDQNLMESGALDYKNKDQIVNRIHNHIERIYNLPLVSDSDRKELSEILWLWYHHQSQIAFFKHKDNEQALRYIDEAIKHHAMIESPNHITELLKLIYEDNFDSAEQYIKNIPAMLQKLQTDGTVKEVKNYEVESARFLVDSARERNKEL